MSLLVLRGDRRWDTVSAFCAGCGLLIERGEPRLVLVDEENGVLVTTMRHESCERRGTLPIFKPGLLAKLREA